MRRVLGALVLAALTCVSTLAATEIYRVAQPIPDQYIAVLAEDVARGPGEATGPTVAQVAQDLALVYQAEVLFVYEHALQGAAFRLPAKRAEALAADVRLAFLEQDAEVKIVATQNNATWGLDRIDQRDLPLSTTYTYDTTASNVHAYVIDTGIRATHNEFSGRVGNGYTSINDGRGTADCHGHGTHVSGTVGGTTYGVAKQVTLHPVRVLNCQGSGTTSGVIAGVDWVTANHVSPAVANMSLGGGASSSLDQAVRNSVAGGVTYAVAAGNDNASACNYSPARVAEALTVGSTTSSDSRSSFSNWGSCVDIFAPGSSITSAWSTSDTAINTISGTSMASPHTAGVAALYLAANPAASPSQVGNAVINNSTTGRLSGIGTGSPNRLLYSLFDAGPPGDDPPVARFTYTCSGLSCDFDGSTSTDDVGIVAYDWTFGDGGSGSGEFVSHTYASGGTYTVNLTVTDTAGQTGSTSQAVTVSEGPAPPCTDCEHYSGFLSGTGDYDWHPNGNYFYSGSGVHRGWLRGPANADFDLYLYKWYWFWWIPVASSTSATSDEEIVYSGSSGYYVWRIESWSGSGSYDFWMKRP